MPLEDYLLGLVVLGATLAGTGAAARWVVARRLPQLVGAPRFLALATCWIAALLLAHLLPAMLGLLAKGSVVVTALLLGLAAWIVPAAGPRAPSPPPPPDHPSGRVAWALAAAAGVVTAVYLLAFFRENITHALNAFDAVAFHLPGVARWIQTGTVWQNDEFVPGYAFGNYPHYGDFMQLAGVLPWRDDAFVRLVNLPLLLLAGTSVYAIACELRAPRALAAGMGVALVTLPAAVVTALAESLVDTLMLAAFGTGVLFLLRHLRTGARSELVLAGVALGIAFGTKWYGAPYVALAIAAWAVAMLLAARPRSAVAREALLLCAVVLLAGGFWLVRNLVEVGNPVFPARVDPLGILIFDAPRDTIRERYGHTIWEYLGDPSVLRHYVWPTFRAYLRLPGALLVAGALAAGVLLVRHRLRGPLGARLRPAALVVCLAAAVAIVYTRLPNSALGPEGRPLYMGGAARYAAPALLLAGAAGAWALGRWARVTLVVLGIASVAAAQSLSLSLDVSAASVLEASLVVAVAGLAGVLGRRAWRSLPAARRPALAAAAALLALAVIVTGGRLVQDRFDEHRYAGIEPPLDWIRTKAPAGTRVGLAGSWSGDPPPVLPAFGPRLRNHVAFVGPMVRGMLRSYHRGGDFAAAVRRGRYDLLLVGRMSGTSGRAGVAPPGERREERWARDLGYTLVARSYRLSLFRAPTAGG